jgi:hypothetical protein
MRVAFRRLLAVLLVAAGLLGGTGITAPTAGALGWGDRDPDDRSDYSQGLNSAIEADRRPSGCANPRLRAVVTHQGVRRGQSIQNTSWGWGWDHDSTGAQNKALISCSQYGAGWVAGWIYG